MQEDVLLPSRNRLEGSLADTPLKALLEPCRKHQVTGTIRVTSREGRGALQLRAGVVEHASFGMLVGDAAVIRMSLLRDGAYELQQRAPELNGQLGKAAAFESDVTRVPLNVVMKHIEQHALTCVLTVQSQYDRGELRYRGGHLLEVLLNGVSEEEALAKVTRWPDAAYKVELDPLAPEISGWPKMRRAETQPFVLEHMAEGTAPVRAPQPQATKKKRPTMPGMPGMVPQGGMSTSPSGPVQVSVMPQARAPVTIDSGLNLAPAPSSSEASGPKKRPPPPPARTPRGSIPPSPAPRAALAEATPEPGLAPTAPTATTRIAVPPPPAARARGTGSVAKLEPRSDESNPLAAFDPLAGDPAPSNAVPERIPAETSAHVSTKAKLAAARAVGSSSPVATPAPRPTLPAPASLTRSSQPVTVPSRPTTIPPTMTAPRRLTSVPPVAVMPGTPALALPRAASVDPFAPSLAPPTPAVAEPFVPRPRRRDRRVLVSALLLAAAIAVLAAAMWFYAQAAQTTRQQQQGPAVAERAGAVPLLGVMAALRKQPEVVEAAPAKLEPAPRSTARPRGTYPSTREDAPRGRRGRRR
jgi:hypothetical protein